MGSLPHHANAPCYGCGGKVMWRPGENCRVLVCLKCGTLIASRPDTRNCSGERPGSCSERTRSGFIAQGVPAGSIRKPRTKHFDSSSARSTATCTGATGAVAGIAAASGRSVRNSTKTGASICTVSYRRRPAICTASSASATCGNAGSKNLASTAWKRLAHKAMLSAMSRNTSRKTET